MTANPSLAPGLYYEVLRPQAEPQPLRSDIAGFVGRTRRGPIGVPIRVEGWREFLHFFGGLDDSADTPYAVRGYFENGGQLAWIIRLPEKTPVRGVVEWPTAPAALDGTWQTEFDRYEVVAATPGAWSSGAQIDLVWHFDATLADYVFDISVRTSGDGSETLAGVSAKDVVHQVALRSNLIRFVPATSATRLTPSSGGRRVRTATVQLAEKPFTVPIADRLAQYMAAIQQTIDQPEIALLAFPDLFNDFDPNDWNDKDGSVAEILRTAIATADALRDRLVLVDLPPRTTLEPAASLIHWFDAVLLRHDSTHVWRAAATYHPAIWVTDPLGGVSRPLRKIGPCGHVAGSVSQIDRDRGAHNTPANVPLIDVIDIAEERTPAEHAQLNERGINLLRCIPRRGYAVMGGRTLDELEGYRFVAHRRLLHRLVRAIRLAAEPLVFETNGPDLWVKFVRAATSVLLPAWRSGALKGERPDQAFRVQCDAETNPQIEIDNGRCICLIAFAPATPMEFVLLRVGLSRDGSLEVLT